MPQSAAELEKKIDHDTLVLYKASSLFPIDLFPTDVIVYATKVDVIDRIFFGAQDVKTVMIPDIFTLEVQTTPFFSSIMITNRQPMTPLIEVKFLRNKDALKLRAIVQGLVVAHYNKLDLAQLPPTQLLKHVEELGATPLPMT
jgi:hypothetical protein